MLKKLLRCAIIALEKNGVCMDIGENILKKRLNKKAQENILEVIAFLKKAQEKFSLSSEDRKVKIAINNLKEDLDDLTLRYENLFLKYKKELTIKK